MKSRPHALERSTDSGLLAYLGNPYSGVEYEWLEGGSGGHALSQGSLQSIFTLTFHDYSSEPTTTNKIKGEAPLYDEGLPPVVSFADQDLVDPLIPPMSFMYAMQPI